MAIQHVRLLPELLGIRHKLLSHTPKQFDFMIDSYTPSVSEEIIKKIKKEGPISFHDFMEMALYYPESGYYTSAKNKIGKKGDYYTSPYVTPLFGEMLGKQFEEMWNFLGRKEFTIVEYGAGIGMLCFDILNYLKNNKELYNQLKYCIIEKSPGMQEIGKRLLTEKVNWYNSIKEIPAFSGCIFSNELLDNFAVHKVVMKEILMEVFVDYNETFIEYTKPATAELNNYFNKLNITLPSGFQTEINLQAIDWINEIDTSIKEGFIITIDYGLSSAELYHECRKLGTLACYKDHIIHHNPYINIGDQDITSHVNFSALRQWGLNSGFRFCGFTNQACFLRSLGFVEHLRKMEICAQNDGVSNTKTTTTYNLLMEMGSKLKVLIQSKGIPASYLSGLAFSQEL